MNAVIAYAFQNIYTFAKNILIDFFLQIVVDPSGNSFVENPHAPRSDPHRDVSQFLRTREQDHALGLYTASEVEAAEAGPDPAAHSESKFKKISIYGGL